jgi:hypothetical protein
MRRIALTLITLATVLALAAPAGAEVRELGVAADAPLPDPTCPDNCTAIVRVSGYPVQIGTHKNPFLITEPGKVVAFSLKLGKPTADQLTFFKGQFGGDAQVRLSVLKPARSKHRHRLLDQSEVINVEQYLGSTPTFALSKPLVVKKRSVIALTVVTWVPAFATPLGNDSAWRFSRENCDDATEPAAQQTIKSLRTYACFKRAARPVYSATFIPDNKVTNVEQTQGNTGQGNTPKR